jgi:hypothetical protein
MSMRQTSAEVVEALSRVVANAFRRDTLESAIFRDAVGLRLHARSPVSVLRRSPLRTRIQYIAGPCIVGTPGCFTLPCLDLPSLAMDKRSTELAVITWATRLKTRPILTELRLRHGMNRGRRPPATRDEIGTLARGSSDPAGQLGIRSCRSAAFTSAR